MTVFKDTITATKDHKIVVNIPKCISENTKLELIIIAKEEKDTSQKIKRFYELAEKMKNFKYTGDKNIDIDKIAAEVYSDIF